MNAAFSAHSDEALQRAGHSLGEALRRHGFSPAGIAEALGPGATAALDRGDAAATRRRADVTTSMGVLIRWLLLHDTLPEGDVAAVIGVPTLADLLSAGAAERNAHGVRLLIDVRAFDAAGSTRYVLSDLDASMVEHIPGPDHVLGIGAASVSLMASVPSSPTGSVLDLGTGSGVLALFHLDRAESVTATDIHPRALTFARASLSASGESATSVELVEGSWFEPVAGRRFDRIVANPPFVVGRPEVGHVYRDSGLALDGASQLVASQAPEFLTPGGRAHVLSAWAHVEGEAWQSRVAGWLPARGVAAWVLQRDVVDPELYVHTWLCDESLDPRSAEYQRRADQWLDFFEDNRVTGIGVGFLALENIGDVPSEVTAEELSGPTAGLGDEVAEFFDRIAWLRERDRDQLAGARYQVRPGLAREEVSVADTDAQQGFAPAALRLTRTDGPRFSHDVDEALAAIVAGLHPHGLSLAETVELFAVARGLDDDRSEVLVAEAVDACADLVRHGLLIPADLIEEI
ncbi:DUF7782 domain-containing protein [Corynebacterium uterequi]|uniref:Methyltransferase family protein n=1 Tax=Corynebacterium uterequi TaxID=1072256 RepID=A0A0G3HD27_9CORY|nr:class I SAM-dependent methyltransferase [Corynebacterium uterequi]AKK11271.1 methyltransferase family protein [Corynebacterium uterequi]